MKFLDEMTITEEREAFKVTDLSSADYCFRKIADIQAKIDEYKAYREAEMEKLTNWFNNESKGLESDIEYFKGLLIEYYQEQKQIDKKFKLSSPHGKLNSRTTKNLVYDEATMMDYLKTSHPELIQTVEKFNKTDVKKIIKNNVDVETGEILNFVEEVENTSYTVKLD